jgi:hypothetical protein
MIHFGVVLHHNAHLTPRRSILVKGGIGVIVIPDLNVQAHATGVVPIIANMWGGGDFGGIFLQNANFS